MSIFNPALSHHAPDHRRAGSLSRAVKSRLQRVWTALEHYGQRRAARELALTAERLQASQPEVAARLRELADERA